MNTPWFLYVVRCKDNSLYTGVTTDVDRRLFEHNSSKRGARYTRYRRPIKLVYWERHLDQSEAQQAEYKFKQLNKKEKERIVNDAR